MTNLFLLSTLVAVGLLVSASWKTQRWVAASSVALVGGAAFVFSLQEEYFDFSFYLFQILLVLLGTAFFVRGHRQKLLVGLSATVLVAAGLAKDSLHLDHLSNIEYTIYLYAAYALLPLLFYSPVKNKEENLEKMVCLQQTWLRALFFHWSLEQGVNISHYDLYRRFVMEFGCIALAVIFLAVIWRRQFFWTLIQQSVLSLLVLSVSLAQTSASAYVVYGWILLLALSSLLPKTSIDSASNRTRFLKRLEYGAFGGGVFWSLIFVVHLGSGASVEGSMLWTFLIFLVGFFSWLRDIPGPTEDSGSAASDLFLVGARACVQALLALIFIYPL